MADGTVGHRFDPTILREYDIRGVVGETLREADAAAHRPQLRGRAGARPAASASPSAATGG